MKLLILIGLLAGSLLAPPSYKINQFEVQAINETNEYRRQNKVEKLEVDTFMCRLAREHSEAMAVGKTPFSHDGFDVRVKRIREKTGIGGVGENVFYASYEADGEDAVNSWINSEGHRRNMINPEYGYIGLGMATGPEGTFYTQLFRY